MFLIEAEQLQPPSLHGGPAQKNESHSLSRAPRALKAAPAANPGRGRLLHPEGPDDLASATVKAQSTPRSRPLALRTRKRRPGPPQRRPAELGQKARPALGLPPQHPGQPR